MSDAEEAMSAIFAERLKQAREERGMTQRALGLRCGADRWQIKAYEHGMSLPRLDRLVALAKVLDCSTDHLCGLEN